MDLTSTESTPWWNLAACRGVDQRITFGETERAIAAMKRICAECPVTAQCLDDARLVADDHFVRGGLTVAERGRLGTKRRRLSCRYCGGEFFGRLGSTICQDLACRRRARNERQATYRSTHQGAS